MDEQASLKRIAEAVAAFTEARDEALDAGVEMPDVATFDAGDAESEG